MVSLDRVGMRKLAVFKFIRHLDSINGLKLLFIGTSYSTMAEHHEKDCHD